MLVGGTIYLLRIAIVSAAVPVIRETLAAVDGDFRILSLDISRRGSGETLRLRANLARPIAVAGGMLHPFGSRPGEIGGMEIHLTLGSVLAQAALLLIVAMAWPMRRIGEAIGRLCAALLLGTIVTVMNAVATFHAELWNATVGAYTESSTLALAWSRFLMGGGGFAMALAFAAIVIVSCRDRERVTQAR